MPDLSDCSLTLTLSAAPPPRLDKALAQVVPEGVALSRSRLGKLIEQGAVARASGGVVRALKTRGLPGEHWVITLPEPADLQARPENIPLDVVYEDADLIVINKPAGMVVHPAPGSETGTLVNALLHHCAGSLSGIGGQRRPGIVHRIDKDTSGLLVVAKSDKAHHGLADQFADHSIERHYSAFVYGAPSRADPRLAGIAGVAFEEGAVIRISGNIARHKHDRKRMAVVRDAGRHAITRLRLVAVYGPTDRQVASQIDCWLETGRTHQIRVHLSHAGHALIGDPVYGGRRAVSLRRLGPDIGGFLQGFQRQALHAATLGFIHPVSGEALTFKADFPQDLKQLRMVMSPLRE
jgi:23S rRNA pseudouridine1911/1915/1917 synthase